jgi:putative transcriptional regulator
MDNKEQKFRNVLGLNIKVARARKQVTQDELAEMVDVSTKHLTKIENGGVTTNVYLITKIAKVLDVTVDELVTEYKNNK